MKAIVRNLQVSPRKVRLVADSIRGMNAEKALRQLTLIEKHASEPLTKVIKSAVANSGKDARSLMIETLVVNEGISLKRFHQATRGRIEPFQKRRSHVSVILKEVTNG